jgi:hypothetical protein
VGQYIAVGALLCAAAGCGNDTVTVRFSVELADVSAIRLVVYEQRADPIDCDALAFSELSDEILDQSLVVEVTGERGEEVALGEIPRDSDKLFFAEAFNPAGISILAGCEPLGAIDGDVDVVIDPEPRLTFVPFGGLAITDGQLEVDNLAVTDVEGNPEGGSLIKWELLAPADFFTEGDFTQQIGAVELGDALPPQPGPLRVTFRARWAEPLELSAFQVPPEVPLALPAGTTASTGVLEPLQVADLGDSVGVVAIVESAAPAQTAEVFCFAEADTASFDHTTASVAMDGISAITRVFDPAGGKVIGVGQADWIEITCDGSTNKPSPFTAAPPARATPMPSCDPAQADPAVYLQTDDRITAVSPDGEPLGAAAGVVPVSDLDTEDRLVTSGCVEANGEAQPTLVTNPRAADLSRLELVVLTASGVRRRGVPGLASAASAFRADQSGSGGLQLGLVTPEGPAIGHYDLQLINETQLVNAMLVDSDPTPSLVTAIASGDIDGNGTSDVVALVSFADEVQVFMSLDMGAAGRLRGFFPGPLSERSAQLRVFDVDNNGVDDVVLLSQDRLTVLDMGGD